MKQFNKIPKEENKVKQFLKVYLSLLLLTIAVAALPGSAWANLAANTQITNNATLNYTSGTTPLQSTASVTVTVSLVPAKVLISNGPDQFAQYTSSAATLTDTFTITAQSNGPDTYNLTASITAAPAGSSNTSGAQVAVNGPTSITLGASVTVLGSDTVNIKVPSDGTPGSSVNGITAGETVAITIGVTTYTSKVTSVTNPGGNGIATIVLTTALPSAPGAGVLVEQQVQVTTTVTAGSITTVGTDVVVSDTLTATSATLSSISTTSAAAINNTFHSGLATLAKYVRNVTTPAAGSGGSYSYGGNTYYINSIAAKPGEVLEYVLVVTNTGTGTVTASVVTDNVPTSYVTLKTGAYSGGEITYVNEAGTASVLTAAADTDAATYSASTLTVYVGTGATSSAGGSIATTKHVLVLYQVTLN
jgi:uncharacterized repeat protein (TIGR01451 family)